MLNTAEMIFLIMSKDCIGIEENMYNLTEYLLVFSSLFTVVYM